MSATPRPAPKSGPRTARASNETKLLRSAGDVIANQFTLVRPLGEGGMAQVWLARDQASGAEVAIKCMSPGPPEYAESLRAEFARLARLLHPNIVRVHDFGLVDGGMPYFTMDLVEGRPMGEALSSSDLRSFLSVAKGVCDGLGAIHATGIVHGDVKPENVLVVGDPPYEVSDVRIVDLGLSGPSGGDSRPRGTVGFAAPEVLKGQAPTPASDLYSLGATFFITLARSTSDAKSSLIEIVESREARTISPLPLRAAGVPPEIERVILSLLEVEPQNRPKSAEEAWEALEPVARRMRQTSATDAHNALVRGAILGRESELKEAAQAFDSESPVVLVTGPKGAGRSRFLRELAVRTEVDDGNAVVLSCAGRTGAGKEWVRRASLIAGSSRALVDWDRLLGKLADHGRVVLILEDLHEATPEDLEIARTALSTSTPKNVCVVLSWLDPPPKTNDRFEVFQMLAQGGWLEERPTEIRLGSLSEEAGSELIRVLLGGAEFPEVEKVVLEQTSRLPVWIETSLAALIERGAIQRDELTWKLDPEYDLTSALPQIDEYLSETLRDLDDSALRWLGALGLLGGAAAAETVARAAGVGPDATAAVRATGLVGAEEVDGREILRAQPLTVCSLALRRLSPEVPNEISRLAAEQLSDEPLRAARLWLDSGEPDRAIAAVESVQLDDLPIGDRWAAVQVQLDAHRQRGSITASLWKNGAKTAESGFYHRDAANLWLEFVETAEPGLERAEGFLAAAEQLRRVSDYDKMGEVLERCELELASLPNDAERSRIRAAVLCQRAWINLIRGELEEAESQTREALRIVPRSARYETFLGWNSLSAILPRLGNLNEGKDAADKAIALADELGDSYAQSRAHGNAAFAAELLDDRVEQNRHLEMAISLARERGDISSECSLESTRFALVASTGTLEEMRHLALHAESLARRSGSVVILTNVLHQSAMFEYRAGNLRRAWMLCKALIHLSRQLRISSAEGSALYFLARISQLRGRTSKARKFFSRSARVFTESKNRNSSLTLRLWGELEEDLGHYEKALRLQRIAAREARNFPTLSAGVAKSFSRLAWRIGDSSLAAEAQELSPLPARIQNDEEASSFLREAEAFQCCLSGRLEEALQHWMGASSCYRDRGYVVLLASCLSDGARALAGNANPAPDHLETANAWLEEARSIYERVGAHGPLTRVLSDLVQLQKQDSVGSTRSSSSIQHDSLLEISEILNSMMDLPDLLRRALRFAGEKLNAERGVIVLTPENSSELELMAQYGDVDKKTRDDALQISTTIVRQVAETGVVFRSHDALGDPRLQTFKSVIDLSLRSVLCAPLRIRNKVAGTIYLQNQTANRAFSDSDIETLESLANLIAITIEKAQYQEELRKANENLVDENVSLRKEVGTRYAYSNLIGNSREMSEVNSLISRFAQVDFDVLVLGETGTGKELVAKTIHYNSSRKDKPFLSINCAAVPETLIEAELFGIDDHVATGVRARKGIFERAEGGTVLLDEIGDMPYELQAKLLRVLQEREFARVGGKRSQRMNVRVISATNSNLVDRVRDNKFREDLYFRVKRLVVKLPPLRERPADIPVLARHFVERFCDQMDRAVPRLSPALLDVMSKSQWRGNVRELEHYIESLLVLEDGPVVEPRVLPSDIEEGTTESGSPSLASLHGHGAESLQESLLQVERDLIDQALRRAGGNRSRAARLLGLPEPTLRYRMKKLLPSQDTS